MIVRVGFPRPLAHHRLALLAALRWPAARPLGSTDTTGSIPPAPAPRSESDWRRDAEAWGERYRANPRDADSRDPLRAGVARDRPARAGRRRAGDRPRSTIPTIRRCSAPMAARSPIPAISSRRSTCSSRAHTPDQPDWRILSVQGAVLDQMGRHDEARRYYASALKIVPDEPSVLSNLGLSYALSRICKAPRRPCASAPPSAAADPRVRQNLALVVGLQGRFQEAETIARADLPPEEAAANVAYLRQMLAEARDLKDIRSAVEARAVETAA